MRGLSIGVSGLILLGLMAPASADVLISQLYGGGGNAGATYENDFIELLNTGSSGVSIEGWSLQYASTTSDFIGSNVTELNGTIQPGHYYLVEEAAGAGGTTHLPTPDITGTINLSATSGKVALVDSDTALDCGGSSDACSTSQTSLIFDLVGYGSADYFEGSGAAPAGSNTMALFRTNDGCSDTDDNAADFTTDQPNPRNTSAVPTACSQDSSTSGPGNGGPINVPEPFTYSLFTTGLVGATMLRRQLKARAAS
jgi:predicted extracellular nuclease